MRGVAAEANPRAMKIGNFSSALLILVFAVSLGCLTLLWAERRPYYALGGLADLSGFLALGLIAATGVLMLFKRRLADVLGSSERLWRVHAIVAAAGGVFLGIHAVIFLSIPLTLPVLVGYGSTGAALFVWVTGGVYFQGARNSMFYHGLFSIGAVFLMLVHTFGPWRNVPAMVSGLTLAVVALAFIAGIVWTAKRAWGDGASRPA